MKETKSCRRDKKKAKKIKKEKIKSKLRSFICTRIHCSNVCDALEMLVKFNYQERMMMNLR